MSERPPDLAIPHDWTFRDAKVAAAFDRHVREQLPWYDLATGALAHLVRHYLPEGGVLYDIGASTGNVGRAVAEILKDRDAGMIASEPSEEMREQYRGPDGVRHLDQADLRSLGSLRGPWYVLTGDRAEDITFYPAPDVVTMFLSLSFVPVAARRRLLQRTWESLRRGGALLVLDKADPPAGYFGQALRRLTLAGKVATGTPPEAIVAKELSLSGVQRPVEFIHLPGLFLPENPHPWAGSDAFAGQFFQFGEFVGWVIER